MQEAYHPLCSECSFCCPNWVPPPILTWWGVTCWGVPYLGTPHPDLARGGTLPWYPPAVPGRVPPLAGPGRVPPQLDLAGYPPSWTWQGTPPPPGVCPMAFWEMLQSIMGYGYPPPPQVWTD